jgi:hypothetical protein
VTRQRPEAVSLSGLYCSDVAETKQPINPVGITNWHKVQMFNQHLDYELIRMMPSMILKQLM